MRMRRKLTTDRRLWFRLSLVVFVLLGFVSSHSSGVENKVGPTYLWGMAATMHRSWAWWEWVPIIAGLAAMVACVAVILGWVAQAVVVLMRTPQGSEKAS